jgi:hypothetical protein
MTNNPSVYWWTGPELKVACTLEYAVPNLFFSSLLDQYGVAYTACTCTRYGRRTSGSFIGRVLIVEPVHQLCPTVGMTPSRT